MERGKSLSVANELTIVAVRMIRWLRAADEASALSGPEASAMAVIVHSGGINPSALAALEQVRRPTITRTVDGLVARGLVRRAPDPADGRGSIVSVTKEGLFLWQTGQARRIAPLADKISALSNSEAQQLEQVLPLLQRLIEPVRQED